MTSRRSSTACSISMPCPQPSSLFTGRRLRRTVNERELAPEDGGWIDGPAPQPEANSLPFFGRLAEFAVVLVELLVRAPVTLDPLAATTLDRKRGVSGKSGSVRVDLGGRIIIKK